MILKIFLLVIDVKLIFILLCFTILQANDENIINKRKEKKKQVNIKNDKLKTKRYNYEQELEKLEKRNQRLEDDGFCSCNNE